jgi:protein-S-isoprenylcysteine O-methyltransferase Ste14
MTAAVPPADQDNPGVIAHPPFLFIAFLAAGIVLHLIRALPLGSAPALRWLGALLMMMGVMLAVWGRRTMTNAGTNINPKQPATFLVVTGPFRYSRNPLYLALTLAYSGLALLINTLWPLILLIILLPMVHWGIVRREERYLERKFGEIYLRYCAVTRRWL